MNVLRLVCFAASMLIYLAADAQPYRFAPVGAIWHYEKRFTSRPGDRDYYKIESIGDTVINGKTCSILQFSDNPGCAYPQPYQYVYQEDSIAYLYNATLNNFQILFDL